MAAPFIPVPGVCQVSVRGLLGSVPVANVFHIGQIFEAGPFSDSDTLAIANLVRTAYVAQFLPLINNAYSIVEVVAQDLFSELGSVQANTTTAPGTHGALMLSAATSQGISWKTRRRYRGGHNRTYLPPPGATAAFLNVNTWGVTHQAALLTAATAFRSAIFAATIGGKSMTMYAVHKQKNNVVLNPRVIDQIDSAAVDSRIDTQRRRLGRDR